MLVLLRSTLLATVPALLPAQTTPPQEAAPLADPGPRIKLAGMRNVVLETRVTFRAAPAEPHRIRTIFSFPDRTRWWLSPEGPTSQGRRLRYGYGERAFGIEPGEAASIEYSGVERLATLRQLALRRHTFLWPDGIAWTAGEGGDLVADLGPVGRLVATLGPDGRPVAVRSEDATGELHEALRPTEWMESAGRLWPGRLAFLARDQPVWDEDLLEVDTTSLFIETFFLPPDRRDAKSAPVDPDRGRVRSVDVPGFYFRRVALRSAGTWERALEQAEQLTRELGKELPEGWSVDPYLTIELSAQTLPGSLLLRIVGSDARPPGGFERRAEQAALCLFLDSPAQLDQAALERLRAAVPAKVPAKVPAEVPAEVKGAAPYARIEPPKAGGNGARRVQLVYPLGDG